MYLVITKISYYLFYLSLCETIKLIVKVLTTRKIHYREINVILMSCSRYYNILFEIYVSM